MARSGALVVIVEVRTRSAGSYERGLASISGQKRARLLRAAERLWRNKLQAMADVHRVRIDVAAVTFEGGATRVEYVAGAIVGA